MTVPLALTDAQLEIIVAVAARLPLRMRDTFLLALADSVAARGLSASDLHAAAITVAKEVVADDARARTV